MNMQKVSLALNLILLLAVGYLFGQHFKEDNSDKTHNEELDKSETNNNSQGRIAFVNVDSLNLNYLYIQDSYDDLEKESRRSQKRLEQKLTEAQNRSVELQKQAVYMTQEQLKNAELEMQELSIKMQNLELEMTNDLQNRQIETNRVYTERLKTYLDEYNADQKYDCILAITQVGAVLWSKESDDITNEVLDHLNSEYAASLIEEEEE
ncbi:MAG: OmpH family outer membrane protein [Bacteroidota bacterium]